MTTEEAIKALQGLLYFLKITKGYEMDALGMAIYALRAQQEEVNHCPCINCGIGWGSANESGVTSCMETCEKLAVYMAQQDWKKNPTPTDPCDLCAYNPPSSLDGKPCCMCPAEAKCKPKEGTK